MSGGANKSFISDPAVFLQGNVILLREGGLPYAPGRYRVNLHAVTDDMVMSETETQLGVFVPFLAQDNPHHTKEKNVGRRPAAPNLCGWPPFPVSGPQPAAPDQRRSAGRGPLPASVGVL
jgi:hypothetical protein